jgi:quinohemoprotein ethanol dehydrogenase
MLEPRWSALTQPRRLLTFALGGSANLPPPTLPDKGVPVTDPNFKSNSASDKRGAKVWRDNHCELCHGIDAVSGGAAPDLRHSTRILSAQAFSQVVRNGALVEAGMPRFEELTGSQLENMRHYLRSRAAALSTRELP